MSGGSQATYAYWKYDESGDVYAVRWVPYGAEDIRVTGVCGPLAESEYVSLSDPSKLLDYNYSSEDVDWIEERLGEFDQLATQDAQ